MRIKLFFCVCFCNLFSAFYSLSAADIIINWKPLPQLISNTESWEAFTDDEGILEFNFPKGYTVNLESINILHNGIRTDFKIKRKMNKYYLMNRELKNEKVSVTINYTIYNFFKKTLIINSSCFYFPLDLVKKSQMIKKENIDVLVNIPEKWEVIEPDNYSYEINGKFKTVSLTARYDEVVLLAGNVNTLLFDSAGDNQYHIMVNSENPLMPSLLPFLKNKNELPHKIDSYRKFITSLYGIEDCGSDMKLLTVQIEFTAVPIGSTIVLNEIYMQTLLISNYSSSSVYHILKAVAMFVLQNHYRDKDIDRWVLEAFSHRAASEYMLINFNKNLGEVNSPFASDFFAGSKISPYASAGNKFRDFYSYRSFEPLENYDTNPLIDFDYRTQSVFNRYGVQTIKILENIAGRDNFSELLKIFINESESLTKNELFDFIDRHTAKTSQIEELDNFTMLYPMTDLVLQRRGDELYIKIKGDKIKLPVEVEYQFKDKRIEREIIFPQSDRIKLPVSIKDIINVRIDPDNLIEELNEANNNLIIDFHFSIIAPPVQQNKYAIVLNQSFFSYEETSYIGGSLSGGWNIKPFNYNSLYRPFLFWSIDGGYSPFVINAGLYEDFLINTSFETSIYPGRFYSPQVYVSSFFNSYLMIHKAGVQGFIPPLVNTEYDNFFFNQSIDLSVDYKADYNNLNKFDFEINTGYKNFYKAWIFSLETLNGVNFNFKNMIPKSIDAGGTLHYKLNLNYLVFENITGILKTFYIDYSEFSYLRPVINRGSTVVHTASYFEKIVSKLRFPQGIGANLNLDSYDFIFNSFTASFNIPIFKEPFMDPMISIGLGTTQDIYFTFYHKSYPEFKTDLLSASFIMDIQRRISMLLRIPVFSTSYIENGSYNYKPGFYFEIKSYL